MIDFHSHILPNMDDGSASVEESLALLRSHREQGIGTVLATPHFYAAENDPAAFLARREASWQKLSAAVTDDLPRILLGSEVCYFDGVSRSGEILSLRIEGTRLLLLEMPFCRWSERMVNEVRALSQNGQVQVLLAHVDRYLPFVPAGVWEDLLEEGVLMQLNAEALLRWQSRRKALRLVAGGGVHVLGSDAHNTAARPVRMGEAMAVIRQKLGGAALSRLEESGCSLLERSTLIK